ncbi:MAG: bifunctional isocitrate dehydrogenase kinase/phosphatase [Granulosicoccus sp.]|nr:bifunctional isocitrate dehydrogenase kinase/phosphatase [Granulosicoccus sp.]
MGCIDRQVSVLLISIKSYSPELRVGATCRINVGLAGYFSANYADLVMLPLMATTNADNLTESPTLQLQASSMAVLQLYEQLKVDDPPQVRINVCARLILAVFDDFYEELCEYPFRAQRAFENMDPQASLQISRDRLSLYSDYIVVHGPRIREVYPELASDEALWEDLDTCYRPLIAARYEADIAFGFAHSIRRNIHHGIWRPVAYVFSRPVRNRAMSMAAAHQRFELEAGLDASTIVTALQIPRFKAPFRDLSGDTEAVAARWQSLCDEGEFDGELPVALDILEAGFFRDLTAFLVGRLVWPDGKFSPFVLALLNDESGIYIEALLYKTADVHNLFSSSLANFHVTNPLYFQTCVFLHSLMPLRPLGQHFSTIGFNHVGKVAILNEIEEQLDSSGEVFASSPGFDGTVAIGFTFNSCSYHLKVIRDQPTRSYKWGEFVGVDAVLEKYRIVHEINRTGSMLDNVMYFNFRMDRDRFAPELLDDLLENAAGSVQLSGDSVLFRALIVQLKIIPLPVYFEKATEEEIARAVNNLGICIKNNMSANIFNRDLDARNYGIGRYNKVFLFDYDAVEKLTDITIDSNVDLEDGEEDIPDWFFSDKSVFLPEELESGLQIPGRGARRLFREVHKDLLNVDYWKNAQRRLQQGDVLSLRVYPEARRLTSTGQSAD